MQLIAFWAKQRGRVAVVLVSGCELLMVQLYRRAHKAIGLERLRKIPIKSLIPTAQVGWQGYEAFIGVMVVKVVKQYDDDKSQVDS